MLRLFVTLICFFTVISSLPVFAGDGTVAGRLLLDTGKPLDNGLVFLFASDSELGRPVHGKFWRVPDLVAETDQEGSFLIDLPVGKYYLAAIKRMSDTVVGPPVEGDYFMPVQNRSGKYRMVTVSEGRLADIGVIRGIKRYAPRNVSFKGKTTAIEGKLVREDGTPAEGMLVFGYTDVSMQGKPQFVSVKSDKNGHYRLNLDRGRVVYLKAREAYSGGPPLPGDPIGFYGDRLNHVPVSVRTDKVVRNIDIMVSPFAQGVQ